MKCRPLYGALILILLLLPTAPVLGEMCRAMECYMELDWFDQERPGTALCAQSMDNENCDMEGISCASQSTATQERTGTMETAAASLKNCCDQTLDGFPVGLRGALSFQPTGPPAGLSVASTILPSTELPTIQDPATPLRLPLDQPTPLYTRHNCLLI